MWATFVSLDQLQNLSQVTPILMCLGFNSKSVWCGTQAYPSFWTFQGFAGGHYIAIDLTAAPPSFSISTLDYQYTYDLTSRATADTCALCGICPSGEACPLDTPAYPENPPDYCDMETAGTEDISGDGPGDGLGPFTWNISVV